VIIELGAEPSLRLEVTGMLVVQQFWVLSGPFGEDGGLVRAAVAEADDVGRSDGVREGCRGRVEEDDVVGGDVLVQPSHFVEFEDGIGELAGELEAILEEGPFASGTSIFEDVR